MPTGGKECFAPARGRAVSHRRRRVDRHFLASARDLPLDSWPDYPNSSRMHSPDSRARGQRPSYDEYRRARAAINAMREMLVLALEDAWSRDVSAETGGWLASAALLRCLADGTQPGHDDPIVFAKGDANCVAI